MYKGLLMAIHTYTTQVDAQTITTKFMTTVNTFMQIEISFSMAVSTLPCISLCPPNDAFPIYIRKWIPCSWGIVRGKGK